jgi:hypothetical protein
MPNFVADETAKRSTGHVDSPKWRYDDTIETEITVKGTQLTRQNWRRNGKPWKPFTGFMPGAGFGAELKPLFSADCPTTFEFERREEARGHQVVAYRYASPPDGCFGFLRAGRRRYNAARAGRVLLDDVGGNIIQFEEEASGFPPGFQFVQRNEVVSWDYVKIGDASYWLPVSADFTWRLRSQELSRVTVDYKNHRHFEASTNLTFK